MPSDFTLENKGGLKNVLFVENKRFGLISAKKIIVSIRKFLILQITQIF